MGSLGTESNQTLTVLEPEHGIITSDDLEILPPRAVNDGDEDDELSNSGRQLSSSFSFSFSSSSSSSSLPGSPLRDPFEEDGDEPEVLSPSTTALPKRKKATQLAPKYGDKDVSGSSTPKDEQPSHEAPESTLAPGVTDHPTNLSPSKVTTESPPTQVMERPGYSACRIPSSVFARTKSTAPVEWSTASNESLFSIHMGNMSFTGDNMFWRSGELGMYGEPPSTSAQMFNFSANPTPPSIATDGCNSCDLGVAEVAVETMKEVLRENAEDQSHEKSLSEGHISRHEESGTSAKSFTFSAMAGDSEKGGSSKPDGSEKRGGSGNVCLENPPSQPHLKQQPEPEPKTVEANTPSTFSRWFSCFSCSSFCC